MSAPVFRHVERLRVRPAEAEGAASCSGAHQLAWVDAARAGYWRALGLPGPQTREGLQGELQLHQATLQIDGPAQADDALEVGLRCVGVAGSQVDFEAEIRRPSARLAQARLGLRFVGTDGRVRPVPAELRELLLGFEAGRPTVEVRVGEWSALGDAARAIRSAVFIDEQRIPADLEWDSADAGCVHAVAYNRLGLPLATGRLLEHVPGIAKIGRMAVLASVRGSGVGRAVLDALMAAARARGDREVLLHAQWSAASFYLRAGFTPRGPRFDEAGIAHQEMVRAL